MMGKDTKGLVKLFEKIGRNIKEIVCKEDDGGGTDFIITDKDGNRYGFYVDDIYAIDTYAIYLSEHGKS